MLFTFGGLIQRGSLLHDTDKGIAISMAFGHIYGVWISHSFGGTNIGFLDQKF